MASEAFAVSVENIDPEESQNRIEEFFQYCGKIAKMQIQEPKEGSDKMSAIVYFEQKEAVQTAVLLDGAKLGRHNISVKKASPEVATNKDSVLPQESKPKSMILAEILGTGYQVSEKALDEAIKFDKDHGLSDRFKSYFEDAKTNAEKIDQRLNISQNLNPYFQTGISYLNKFYDSVIQTSVGTQAKEYVDDARAKLSELLTEAQKVAEQRKQDKQQSEEPKAEEVKASS